MRHFVSLVSWHLQPKTWPLDTLSVSPPRCLPRKAGPTEEAGPQGGSTVPSGIVTWLPSRQARPFRPTSHLHSLPHSRGHSLSHVADLLQD